MIPGFTFNGIHSSQFNVYCDPASRQLIPERRRSRITVPGRSGTFSQEDGAFNDRTESFTCWYTRKPNSDISRQAREIAAWLAEDGILCFDHEPDKFYNAAFTGAPPLTKHLMYGEFSLTFTYSPPFAYTTPQSVVRTVTREADTVTVRSKGTAPTPCRIIITNRGDTAIQNLRIVCQHH